MPPVAMSSSSSYWPNFMRRLGRLNHPAPSVHAGFGPNGGQRGKVGEPARGYSGARMQGRFDPAVALCQQAVDDGVVPGLVLLVASEGIVRFHEGFGHRHRTPPRLPALPDTVYDVASLTKAVATSVVAMQLCERGALGLEDPVRQYVPEFPAGPDRD